MRKPESGSPVLHNINMNEKMSMQVRQAVKLDWVKKTALLVWLKDQTSKTSLIHFLPWRHHLSAARRNIIS